MSKQTEEYRFKIQRIDAIGRVLVPIVNCSIICGTVGVCCFLAYKAVVSLSGKNTDANILINFITAVKLDQWTAYAIGALGGVYGYAQHRQRKKVIKHKSERIQYLEALLNPDRKSSLLAIDGSTRKGDIT